MAGVYDDRDGIVTDPLTSRKYNDRNNLSGRAILRGFVTPDRTTLITSTHRALAVSEKMVPGDGIASSEEVMAAAGIAADFQGVVRIARHEQHR